MTHPPKLSRIVSNQRQARTNASCWFQPKFPCLGRLEPRRGRSPRHAILRPISFMRSMSPKACLSLLLPLFLLAHGMAQPEAPQPPWTAPANDLVREVLSRSGAPPTILVSFESFSSLSAHDQETIQKAILDGFRAAGIRLVNADLALAGVQIALSEDW